MCIYIFIDQRGVVVIVERCVERQIFKAYECKNTFIEDILCV